MVKLVRENVEVDSNSGEANIEAEDQESDHALNCIDISVKQKFQLNKNFNFMPFITE